MRWKPIDQGLPAAMLPVLCWGCPQLNDDEPYAYLAWWDEGSHWWMCDVTGQRVLPPLFWAQVEPPGRFRLAISVRPQPDLEVGARVNIDGFAETDAATAIDAAERVVEQLASLFEGHDVSAQAVMS